MTVRTLHHYEHIGLLASEQRTDAGYRRYSEEDLQRLQHVLYYRELGFPLDDIATILDDPAADTRAHLVRQRTMLTDRIARLQRMVVNLDKHLEAATMGIDLTPEERFEIFGPEHAAKLDSYTAEAEREWGETDAWAQSRARTSRFSKEQWRTLKEAGDDLNRRLAAALQGGASPDGDEAAALAEEHRRSIEQFYDCSYAMHRQLGAMYVEDERFAKTYNDVAPGLAGWLRDAIDANAARHGVTG